MNEEIPPWAKEIIERLDRIEAALKPENKANVLDIDGVANCIGRRSRSAAYRWLESANVKSCRPGGWLEEHVTHGLRVVAVSKRWRKK